MEILIMTEIYKNLFVGNDNDCRKFEGAIVHACQSCFVRGVCGNVRGKVVFENIDDLYLNLLDISTLSYDYAYPIIKKSIEFIDKKIKEKKVLIHCNFGASRSPSIALIYMANKGYIDNSSVKNAVSDFKNIYNNYYPGFGMYKYFERYWDDIIKF